MGNSIYCNVMSFESCKKKLYSFLSLLKSVCAKRSLSQSSVFSLNKISGLFFAYGEMFVNLTVAQCLVVNL